MSSATRLGAKPLLLGIAALIAIAAISWVSSSDRSALVRSTSRIPAQRTRPVPAHSPAAERVLAQPAADDGVEEGSLGPSGVTTTRVELVTAQLESSGAAPRHWLEELKPIFSAWKRKAAVPGGTEFGEWSCHADGCFLQLTFPDEAAFGAFNHLVGPDDPFIDWAERTTLVGPDRATNGGRVQALWVVAPKADLQQAAAPN